MNHTKNLYGLPIVIITATIIFLAMIALKLLPTWYLLIFNITFALCMIGWEMWMTYGIVNGKSVYERSGKENSSNMVLMCLGDALIGVLQIWSVMKIIGPSAFRQWNWKAFAIIFLIGIIQNILVTMAIYKQIENESISWAPMMPIKMNSIIQIQLPWILQPFILYPLVIILIGSVKTN